MPFVRVRGVQPGDPLHEFDVTVGEATKHADLYEVLDAEPVAVARPAVFFDKKPARPAKKRTAKPAGETTKPRQGHDSKE